MRFMFNMFCEYTFEIAQAKLRELFLHCKVNSNN